MENASRTQLKDLIREQVNSGLQLMFNVLGPRPTEKSVATSVRNDLIELEFGHHHIFSVQNVVVNVRNTKNTSNIDYTITLNVLKNAEKFGKMPIKVNGYKKLVFD